MSKLGQFWSVPLFLLLVCSVFSNPPIANCQGESISDVLRQYQSDSIDPKSEAWNIVTTVIQNQYKIESGANGPNPEANNWDDIERQLVDRFESIGKAELAERALYAYRLCGASKDLIPKIDIALEKQASLVRSLYNSQELQLLLSRADELVSMKQVGGESRRLIDLMKADVAVNAAIPLNILRARKRIRVEGRSLHASLKRSGDQRAALAWLTNVFSVEREAGRAIAKSLDLPTPYDGLLASFQPGYGSEKLERLFAELIPNSITIAREAIRRQQGEATSFPTGPFALARQETLNRQAIKSFGLDPTRFHLLFSEIHSVEGGIRGDVRLVVNLNDSRLADFTKSNRSTFHEIGHGLYIDGIPADRLFSPTGKLMGTGVEEGYAFLAEKIITRSRPFAEFICPEASMLFEQRITVESYCRHRTRVAYSQVRVAADEVTYPQHIAIRMNIERDLINGQLRMEDMPAEWKTRCMESLGSEPRDYAESFGQDVHWFVGKIGMFPFYTVGDVIAAQLWSAISNDLPDIEDKIRAGDLSAINSWLQTRAFSKGRFYDLDDYMRAVMGEPLQAKFYIEHLTNRYSHH